MSSQEPRTTKSYQPKTAIIPKNVSAYITPQPYHTYHKKSNKPKQSKYLML